MDPLRASLLTDLVSATKQGDVEHVRRLLSLGVKPDVIDLSSSCSALHASVLHNLSLLSTLLEYTTDPDAPLFESTTGPGTPRGGGATPLSYIVHELGERPDTERKQRLFEAMDLLLRAGANPRSGAADQTPLELARLYGMADVEEALLAKRQR